VSTRASAGLALILSSRKGAKAQRKPIVISLFAPSLILTGTCCFIRILPDLKGWALFHGLFGVKLMLSAALFMIAIGLLASGTLPDLFQRDRANWLAVNVALGAVIVLLSAVLRRLCDFPH
jgi:phosphotransferase system  glucose/maltose/N-acetylglucosamine-specific IIC component